MFKKNVPPKTIYYGVALSLLTAGTICAQTLFFPGAEGFGPYAQVTVLVMSISLLISMIRHHVP